MTTPPIKPLTPSDDSLENKYRIIALKKAAIVMNRLADSFKDEWVKQETKSLAWTIQWAIEKLAELGIKE